MAIQKETELYAPVKAFLEQLGYEVKSEVKSCDIVAIRTEEPESEPLIVELKKTFNVPLLVQGIQRLSMTDQVYVAVERKTKGKAPHGLHWNELVQLCRRLGLGLLTVRFYKRKAPLVEALCDPTPYSPRKSDRRKTSLLHEFHERSGDYNTGGSSQSKLMTAYREKALHCAVALHREGQLSPRQIKEMSGVAIVPSILQKNYYGWFERLSRGLYKLTPAGESALEQYAEIIEHYKNDIVKQS